MGRNSIIKEYFKDKKKTFAIAEACSQNWKISRYTDDFRDFVDSFSYEDMETEVLEIMESDVPEFFFQKEFADSLKSEGWFGSVPHIPGNDFLQHFIKRFIASHYEKTYSDYEKKTRYYYYKNSPHIVMDFILKEKIYSYDMLRRTLSLFEVPLYDVLKFAEKREDYSDFIKVVLFLINLNSFKLDFNSARLIENSIKQRFETEPSAFHIHMLDISLIPDVSVQAEPEKRFSIKSIILEQIMNAHMKSSVDDMRSSDRYGFTANMNEYDLFYLFKELPPLLQTLDLNDNIIENGIKSSPTMRFIAAGWSSKMEELLKDKRAVKKRKDGKSFFEDVVEEWFNCLSIRDVLTEFAKRIEDVNDCYRNENGNIISSHMNDDKKYVILFQSESTFDVKYFLQKLEQSIFYMSNFITETLKSETTSNRYFENKLINSLSSDDPNVKQAIVFSLKYMKKISTAGNEEKKQEIENSISPNTYETCSFLNTAIPELLKKNLTEFLSECFESNKSIFEINDSTINGITTETYETTDNETSSFDSLNLRVKAISDNLVKIIKANSSLLNSKLKKIYEIIQDDNELVFEIISESFTKAVYERIVDADGSVLYPGKDRAAEILSGMIFSDDSLKKLPASMWTSFLFSSILQSVDNLKNKDASVLVDCVCSFLKNNSSFLCEEEKGFYTNEYRMKKLGLFNYAFSGGDFKSLQIVQGFPIEESRKDFLLSETINARNLALWNMSFEEKQTLEIQFPDTFLPQSETFFINYENVKSSIAVWKNSFDSFLSKFAEKIMEHPGYPAKYADIWAETVHLWIRFINDESEYEYLMGKLWNENSYSLLSGHLEECSRNNKVDEDSRKNFMASYKESRTRYFQESVKKYVVHYGSGICSSVYSSPELNSIFEKISLFYQNPKHFYSYEQTKYDDMKQNEIQKLFLAIITNPGYTKNDELHEFGDLYSWEHGKGVVARSLLMDLVFSKHFNSTAEENVDLLCDKAYTALSSLPSEEALSKGSRFLFYLMVNGFGSPSEASPFWKTGCDGRKSGPSLFAIRSFPYIYTALRHCPYEYKEDEDKDKYFYPKLEFSEFINSKNINEYFEELMKSSANLCGARITDEDSDYASIGISTSPFGDSSHKLKMREFFFSSGLFPEIKRYDAQKKYDVKDVLVAFLCGSGVSEYMFNEKTIVNDLLKYEFNNNFEMKQFLSDNKLYSYRKFGDKTPACLYFESSLKIPSKEVLRTEEPKSGMNYYELFLLSFVLEKMNSSRFVQTMNSFSYKEHVFEICSNFNEIMNLAEKKNDSAYFAVSLDFIELMCYMNERTQGNFPVGVKDMFVSANEKHVLKILETIEKTESGKFNNSFEKMVADMWLEQKQQHNIDVKDLFTSARTILILRNNAKTESEQSPVEDVFER